MDTREREKREKENVFPFSQFVVLISIEKWNRKGVSSAVCIRLRRIHTIWLSSSSSFSSSDSSCSFSLQRNYVLIFVKRITTNFLFFFSILIIASSHITRYLLSHVPLNGDTHTMAQQSNRYGMEVESDTSRYMLTVNFDRFMISYYYILNYSIHSQRFSSSSLFFIISRLDKYNFLCAYVHRRHCAMKLNRK